MRSLVSMICDILYSYYDCWKSTTERHNAVFQGIVEVASIFDSKFCIQLDFEILESSLPLYQYGLGSRLTYELTFADYSVVVKSSNADVSHTISNISLEFDTVTNASLANQIRTEYMKSSILYDRILRSALFHSMIPIQAFQWILIAYLKGVLLIFIKERSTTKFNQDTEEFYTPR